MADKLSFDLKSTRLLVKELDSDPALQYDKVDLSNLNAVTNSNDDPFLLFTESTPSTDYIELVQNGTGSVQMNAAGLSIDVDLDLAAKGTGNVSISGYKMPNVDGTSGQILSTDGAGNISFVDPSASSGTTQNLFATFNADTGTTTADTATDTLTIAGGFGMATTIVGDTLTLDFVDVINRWETINADSGSTAADTETDILTVSGGTNITTTIVGDTLTIDTSAITSLSDDSSPTLSSNLELNGFQIIDTTDNRVTISGLNYPATDGEAGQFLQTNGAGSLDFSNTRWRRSTVTTSDATITTIDTISIASGEQKVITARVMGYESATTDSKWVVATGGFKNVAGTVSQVGGISSQSGTDTGATAWTVELVASGAGVDIQVTGEAAHTIDWQANIEVS